MAPTSCPRPRAIEALAAIRHVLERLSEVDRIRVLLMLAPEVEGVLQGDLDLRGRDGDREPSGSERREEQPGANSAPESDHKGSELFNTPGPLAGVSSGTAITEIQDAADGAGPADSAEPDAADARELAWAPQPARSAKQRAFLSHTRIQPMAVRKKANTKRHDERSFVVSAHGYTVLVVRKPNGTYHRRHQLHEQDARTGELRKVSRQRTLGTTDPSVARRRAEAFLEAVHREARGRQAATRPAEALMITSTPTDGGRITVGEAVVRYVQSKSFAALGEKTRSSYRSALAALAASLGHDTILETVSTEDLERHAAARLATGFRYRSVDSHGHWARTDTVKDVPVKPETVNADFTTLSILWNWCARTSDGAGQMLVRFTAGPTAPRQIADRQRRRPVGGEERLLALMQHVRGELDKVRASIIRAEAAGLEVHRGLRFSLRRNLFLQIALLLAGLCGQRIGDIARLAWADVDLDGVLSDEGPSLTFRIKNTKGGKPLLHRVHIPEAVMQAVREALESIGSHGFSPWVLPAHSDSNRHVNPDELGKWLDEATRRAGLRKLSGGIWHPLRRGWTMMLLDRGWDAQRVATLGGWRDFATFHKCYALQTPKSQRSMLETTPMANMIAARTSNEEGPALRLHREEKRLHGYRPSKRASG